MRCISCVVAALLLTTAGCGDDDDAGVAQTTRTAAQTALDGALWPDPATAREGTGPVAVARSFVEELVGMARPALGPLQLGDARSGEVPMFLVGEDGRAREDQVLATILVRQLDGRRWFVVGAVSDRIEIEAPQALDEVSSPVTVAGLGRGFESNLVVSARSAFRRPPLAESPTAAGDREPRPFSLALTFPSPETATGAIVVRDGGALDGVATAFAAVPVRFTGP